jgi:Glycosyl transferase family 2
MESASVSPTSWAGSIQVDVRAVGLEPEASWPTEAAAAYIGAAVIMMAKDEGDIISHNLRWLYFVGFRRFVVIDNDSRDDTAKQLIALREDFADIELLIISDSIVRYMQAQKMTGLYRFALSIWPDVQWVFPIDADEFLIPQSGLAILETLSPRIDALTIPKSIHFRNRKQQRVESDLFFDCMGYCSPIFEVPPKIALHRNPFISITQGNHKAALLTRPEVYEGGFRHGFYFREYPVRSFEHFVRKVRNGGRAIRAAEAFLGHAVGGMHWLAAYEVLQTEDEPGLMSLYERNWINDPPERFSFAPFRGTIPHTHRPDTGTSPS